MLNRVVLVGRLTANPELRKTNAGTSVTSFSIAVDNALANPDGSRATCFISGVVFNTQAENVAKCLKKGSLIAVDGKLNQRKFQDQFGNNRSVIEVVVDIIKFLDKKSDDKLIPSEQVARDEFEEADQVDEEDEAQDLPWE